MSIFLFTFIFGTLRVITWTYLFKGSIHPPMQSFGLSNKNETPLLGFLLFLDGLIGWFCIAYQVYWWFSYFGIDISTFPQ